MSEIEVKKELPPQFADWALTDFLPNLTEINISDMDGSKGQVSRELKRIVDANLVLPDSNHKIALQFSHIKRVHNGGFRHFILANDRLITVGGGLALVDIQTPVLESLLEGGYGGIFQIIRLVEAKSTHER